MVATGGWAGTGVGWTVGGVRLGGGGCLAGRCRRDPDRSVAAAELSAEGVSRTSSASTDTTVPQPATRKATASTIVDGIERRGAVERSELVVMVGSCADRQGTVSGRPRHPRPRIPDAGQARRRTADGCRTQRLSVSSGSWRSSSVVEQGTHKPLVGGSNPPSATRPIPTDGPPPGGPFRFLHLRTRHHPAPSGVRTHDRGQDLCHGVVIALDAILGPTGGARSSPARPRRLPLNPKFFRNGIVMLVLVVGTAALLFTWINSTTPPPRSATRSSWPTSRAARSTRSSSRARP